MLRIGILVGVALAGDFVLLMEDLAPAEQGNQLTGCSTDQARTAVLELAKLHGPRWGDTTLYDVEWLSRRSPQDSLQLAMLWGIFLPGFMNIFGRYLSTEATELLETQIGHVCIGNIEYLQRVKRCEGCEILRIKCDERYR